MIARDPVLELSAWYAARGAPLGSLASASPAEIAFLAGARALYYDDLQRFITSIVGGDG